MIIQSVAMTVYINTRPRNINLRGFLYILPLAYN